MHERVRNTSIEYYNIWASKHVFPFLVNSWENSDQMKSVLFVCVMQWGFKRSSKPLLFTRLI